MLCQYYFSISSSFTSFAFFIPSKTLLLKGCSWLHAAIKDDNYFCEINLFYCSKRRVYLPTNHHGNFLSSVSVVTNREAVNINVPLAWWLTSPKFNWDNYKDITNVMLKLLGIKLRRVSFEKRTWAGAGHSIDIIKIANSIASVIALPERKTASEMRVALSSTFNHF